MAIARIKKNDTVIVTSGNSAGKTGTVKSVDPKKGTAIVEGVEKLTPANIQAYDLRAGAAMLIAALAADGVSEITNVQYIERGYEDIIGKLRALGAKIDCVEENDEPPIRQIG